MSLWLCSALIDELNVGTEHLWDDNGMGKTKAVGENHVTLPRYTYGPLKMQSFSLICIINCNYFRLRIGPQFMALNSPNFTRSLDIALF
jgi:hypothetical protein